MTNKEDLRITKTKLSIRNAFMELCKKKPVSKITITELANLAMINKGTFYLHYNDIYDLYLEVVKDVCMNLFTKADDFSLFFTAPEDFVRRWYNVSFDNTNEFTRAFPHSVPNELGFQIPNFVISEFKNRIFATGYLDLTPENELKVDCIICNLMLSSYPHYKKDPEMTIRTMADLIRRSFS